MKRSRYYRPAGLATGTIAMTVLAAVVVFSSVLYLNFFHEEHTRLFSSSRYPPTTRPRQRFACTTTPARTSLLAPISVALLFWPCSNATVLVIPPSTAAPTANSVVIWILSAQQHRLCISSVQWRAVKRLQQYRPPHSPTQCRDCSAGACLNAVRSDRDSTDRLYQHFNQPYDLSKPSDTPCPDTDSAPWILIDGRGQAKLYFHTRPHAAATRAAEMARDYLTVLAESTREDSADTGIPESAPIANSYVFTPPR